MSLDKEVEAAMEASLSHLKQELKGLRTSRANPSLLDHVTVEVYGTHMRLKEIGNITVPEPRQLLITPFDPSNTSAVAKGIEKCNLGLQARVDGHVVRINIPPMDETIRKEMVKESKKKTEDGKVSIREIRRKYNDLVRKKQKDGEISEDIQNREEKMIQEKTDKFCKLCDKACADKEKEILEI